MNWKEVAALSPYRTAIEAREALRRGDISEASAGMQELIDALSRSDRRALKSQLIRLMTHLIKWRTQPNNRSRSWRTTIRNARREIADIQQDTPSLNRAVIEAMWEDCLLAAREEAEGEMNQTAVGGPVSWEQAFEEPYDLLP